jgi:hypothetical protein
MAKLASFDAYDGALFACDLLKSNGLHPADLSAALPFEGVAFHDVMVPDNELEKARELLKKAGLGKDLTTH